MTRRLSRFSIAVAALLIGTGLAVAQTPQPPPAATPKAPPAAAPKAPPAAAPKAAEPAAAKAGKGVPKRARTPEGIECSKQADEKKLHGKERRSFREKCIRALKKAAKKN